MPFTDLGFLAHPILICEAVAHCTFHSASVATDPSTNMPLGHRLEVGLFSIESSPSIWLDSV
jgi:hypothetical protein